MTVADTRLASIALARLAAWMQGEGLGRGEITAPQLLAGGTQNLIVRFQFGGRDFVLRKAAPTAYANGNETMRREARVLAALAATAVPHARLIAACATDDVLGGAFYLMEPVEGFNVGNGMPGLHANSPALRHAMGLSMVDGLAALRGVDPVAVGLADFGRTEGFLERQVERWRSQLHSYARYAGWPGSAALPEVDALGDWLQQHRPRAFQPGLQHGDFHLKNVLFRPDGPGLAAIIDWELSTLGDPMIDLGWLLATWRDAGEEDHGSPIVIEPWAGFPSAAELVAHYAQRTGADVAQVPWYRAFAAYKLALLLEGSHARACAGQADAELGRRFHTNARKLLLRAARWTA